MAEPSQSSTIELTHLKEDAEKPKPDLEERSGSIFRHKHKEEAHTYDDIIKTMQERHPDIKIENLGEKAIFMARQEDQLLLREIVEFHNQKTDNPESKNFDAAMEKFCGKENGDALVKVVYDHTDIDFVIKLNDQGKFPEIRAMWESKVIKKGLIFQIETGVTPKEIYYKVYTPFSLLCIEAETRRITLPLLEHDSSKEVKKETILQSIITFFNPEDRVVPEASAPFRTSEIRQFRGGLDSDNPCRGDEPMSKLCIHFFRHAHRNLLTYELLNQTLLKPSDLAETPDADHFPKKANLSIHQMIKKGIYHNMFPVHDGSFKSTQANPNLRTKLTKHWAKAFFSYQPLDQIRDYFGEKIALYFAYLGFYTVWLWSLSIIGVICFIFGIAYAFSIPNLVVDQRVAMLFDNPLTIPWAVFVSIWATTYLEFWKRKNAYLAWWWDVLDFEREEITRPEWYGTKERISPITGRLEYHYPDRLRYAKMAASTAAVGIAVIIVIVGIMGSVVYQVWSRDIFGTCVIKGGVQSICATDPENIQCDDPCWLRNETNCLLNNTWITSPVKYQLCAWINTTEPYYCAPACTTYNSEITCVFTALLGDYVADYRVACDWSDPYYRSQITAALINLFVIVVLNKVFEILAAYLNDWENHKTDTQYDDALIVKTFFFMFLNSYSSLFYIAFFKGTLAQSIFGDDKLRDICSYGSCFTELLVQLAIIFVGKQMINQTIEVVIPWFQGKLQTKQQEAHQKELQHRYSAKHGASWSTKDVPQYVKDDRLAPINTTLFDDYNEMALQFGFITLFVSAFPLGPLFALLNNLVEIRSDAIKYCTTLQRPPARQAQDIGTWENVLQALGLMAVITNAFIVGFSSVWVTKQIELYVDESAVVAGRLLVVLLFEHAVFGLKILIAWLVPDIPGPVQIAIDRERYLAKKALDGLEDNSLLGNTEEDDDEATELKQ